MIKRNQKCSSLFRPARLALVLLTHLALSAGGVCAAEASARAGELCVEGRLQGPIASNANTFTVGVVVVEVQDSSRAWLPAVTPKLVMTDSSTQFVINGQLFQNFYYADDGRSFYHVRVRGVDQGRGQPLMARSVWLENETDTERFLYEHCPTGQPSGADDAAKPAPQVGSWTQTVWTNGEFFPVTVVSAKLGTVSVRCGLAKRQVGATESLGAIAGRYGAIAAINGSFFDCFDHSDVKMPDTPLICRGKVVSLSNIGTLLGFSEDGHWRMDLATNVTRMCGPACSKLASDDPDTFLFWSHVSEALGCGPRLVVDGAPKLNPYAERISSDEVLTTHAVRSAVGITADEHILFVVAPHATLNDMADIMAALGARQAMNLDGGSSSGLWYRGNSLVAAGRELSNALLIMPK